MSRAALHTPPLVELGASRFPLPLPGWDGVDVTARVPRATMSGLRRRRVGETGTLTLAIADREVRPAYVGADRDSQWRASPLAYADDIAVPLLIIHSEQDWRCPLEQGQRLFVAWKSRGAEGEMLVFRGEGHELSRSGRPRHRRQRFDAILDWWARYLPVESEPEPSGR